MSGLTKISETGGTGKAKAPHVFIKLSPAKPTAAFDTYWNFAVERQKIFFARVLNQPPPWTDDPILSKFKFTNAYRASDRVSQYLIKHVISAKVSDPTEIFFRVMLFKLFNKIETWERLEANLGRISWSEYKYKNYDKILSKAMNDGARIYSAAYIMASGHKIFNVERKHQSHLKLLELMIAESVPQRLADSKSMRHGFELLRSYPLIGDFLAYQLITDLNYSDLTDFSEMEFTMPGPGAKDGIRKCFESLGGLTEAEIIRLMADRQEFEFDRLGLNFQSLWGRRLQLIDTQNLFCEVDKYSRVRHPDLAGISGRTRIKQKFQSNPQSFQYVYPKKWGLIVPQTSISKSRQTTLL